ncbi:dual oxidase-like [Sitophilus oryzae]|uniref:Dual oxidase-like n=1 Tax=Sitophilus oryzae TaxID=7048 RepID=A0A6J2YKI5_SITOR|nr:dual oxidase-like [Sitophilus oryzae]
MAEHTDLRHIMGVGIAITRGSAASLSFCYSILLLTMCRNFITKLKEFSIHQYIPLDANIQFHKIAACTGLFFSLLHTVGHIVNFYHVSTQPIENLKCLTNEIRFNSDYKPGISFWLFQTITGITGVLLFIIMCIIVVFAHPTIRKKAYKFFWFTHSLYVLLYALCLIHGLARLTGPPRFWMFFIGPGIIFTLDKVVSLRTRYIPLDVFETDLLPSDVIKIKFYRPPNLKYLSGQWVRLTCTAFKDREFHSFTLTSAPHENFLSCHIKAQEPHLEELLVKKRITEEQGKFSVDLKV